MNYLSILNELGYVPYTRNTGIILSDLTKKVFEECFGNLVSKDIMLHMSSYHGVQENELLSKYELIEESLRYVLGEEPTRVILDLIKAELLQYVDLKDTDLTIDKILQEISYHETIKFIHQIGGHEHILLLYKNNKNKDKILSAFFRSQETKQVARGLFSVKPSTISSVRNMTFDELLGIKKTLAMKKLSDWIDELHSSNKSNLPTRIGGEDTWFFENGFGNEILQLEKAIGSRIKDKMTILCTYDISKVSDVQTLKSLISSHGYVISDDPFMIYKDVK